MLLLSLSASEEHGGAGPDLISSEEDDGSRRRNSNFLVAIRFGGTDVNSYVFTWSERFPQQHIIRNGGSTSLGSKKPGGSSI